MLYSIYPVLTNWVGIQNEVSFFSWLFVCNWSISPIELWRAPDKEAVPPLAGHIISPAYNFGLPILVRSLHSAHSPANHTTACQKHFEKLDVSKFLDYSFSGFWVPSELPYFQWAQCGHWLTVRHSKADIQTSSHPQNSASHLLGLQGL